jgi:DNA-binding transcriptional LysR family regulator
MENLVDMAVFAVVVEAGSFTGAAARLGLSKSAVSKRVKRLELRLGTSLLQRTTRRLALTDAGELYYRHCAKVVAEAHQAEIAVNRVADRPQGVLRLNAPMAFGQMHIAPIVEEFLDRYSELSVELTLADSLVDLSAEGVDIAIRVAQDPGERYIAREIAPVHRVVCASSSYLNTHGVPANAQELAAHNCLGTACYAGGETWILRDEQGQQRVQVRGGFASNDAGALREAALTGLGIVMLPTFVVGTDIQAGLLMPLNLKPVDVETVYAVYTASRERSPKVAAFVDFLREQIGDPPYWEIEGKDIQGWVCAI